MKLILLTVKQITNPELEKYEIHKDEINQHKNLVVTLFDKEFAEKMVYRFNNFQTVVDKLRDISSRLEDHSNSINDGIVYDLAEEFGKILKELK